ncbi:MAG: hypothetical protein Q7K42_01810 [Candidatus Diapherotrites archaeon]|nr:hypothetical protein [Candidatus Diapherotrites archaeon]
MRVKVFAILLVLLSASVLLFGCTQTNQQNNSDKNTQTSYSDNNSSPTYVSNEDYSKRAEKELKFTITKEALKDYFIMNIGQYSISENKLILNFESSQKISYVLNGTEIVPFYQLVGEYGLSRTGTPIAEIFVFNDSSSAGKYFAARSDLRDYENSGKSFKMASGNQMTEVFWQSGNKIISVWIPTADFEKENTKNELISSYLAKYP